MRSLLNCRSHGLWIVRPDDKTLLRVNEPQRSSVAELHKFYSVNS